MADAHHALPGQCPNCSADVHGPYCAQCGQHTIHELPTLREFAHEFLHHYIAAEGKLVPTVKLLLFKPGQLTLEYLAGRRQRYVKPLSLYVTFSFLFFLFLGWSGSVSPGHMVRIDNRPAEHPAEAIMALSASEADPEGRLALKYAASIADQLSQPAKLAAFQDHMLERLPYSVFVLMPVFAALCALVYRGRKETYGLHLLFTVHLHAFVFAIFLLCLLPGVMNYAGWFGLLILGYLIIALKQVQGGRWWPQILRGLLLGGVYSVISSLALTLVILASSGLSLQLH